MLNPEGKNKLVVQIEELLTKLVGTSKTFQETGPIEKMLKKWTLRLAVVDALIEAKEGQDSEESKFKNEKN
jgi:hypothetical protein